MGRASLLLAVIKRSSRLTIEGNAALFFCLVFLLSCKETSPPTCPEPLEPHIIVVRPSYDSVHNIVGSYKLGVWVRNTIYCASPFRQVTLGEGFQVVRDTILDLFSGFRFLSVDGEGNRLL